MFESSNTSSAETSGAAGESGVPKYIPPHKFNAHADKEGPQLKEQKNNQGKQSKGVCHFFAQTGRCRFGNSCRFTHIKENEGGSEEQTDVQAENEGPLLKEQKSKQEKQSKGVCHFFVQTGRCKFGNSCRFTHTKENEGISEEQTDEEAVMAKNSKTGQSKNEKDTTKMGVCRYYARNKHCNYGEKCRYQHVFNPGPRQMKRKEPSQKSNENQKTDVVSENISTTKADIQSFPVLATPGAESDTAKKSSESSTNLHVDDSKETSKKIAPKCRYFMSGNCRMGIKCKFSHPEEGQRRKGNEPLGRQRQQHDRQMGILLSEATEEVLKQNRITEIEQLKKRFPKALLIKKMNDNSTEEGYKVTFIPTDPDWPFDVKEVGLQIFFPRDYPKESMDITIVEDERLPETVRKCIEEPVQKRIETRFQSFKEDGKLELAFRPFLRWLDKNLENIMTEGLMQYKRELVLKAAGIEFVPASELQEKYKSSDDPGKDLTEDENIAPQTDLLSQQQNEDKGNSSDDSEDGEHDVQAEEKSGTLNPPKKGTEIKLISLQLKDSAATLSGTQINLVLQCGRCKHQTDVVTPPGRINLVLCGRCNNQQLVTYHATMVHQFASVLGYLDVDGCLPFDLILSECQFKVGCLGCSKQMVMQGLPPGQPKDTWCQYCHEKMRFAVESVRFNQLQPANQAIDINSVHVLQVKKVGKVAKDPAIQERKPLPDNGTCKHYKKSFRWLRFPCCGKAYPCDLCHDEKETDHEMKYANRMICGFCCKEQSYAAERPCVACDSSMTKKTGPHWEGGQGCRDKIKMAKGDSQKYAGSLKTVSRKAQAKTLPGKKITKLRHS